jgi:hypothetical protein
MDFDFAQYQGLMAIIGWLTVIAILTMLLLAIVLVTISLYSIKKGRLYFPEFLRAGLVFVEGLTKAIFRFLGLEDREMLSFFIKLNNTMSKREFARVPVTQRAIFLPQCLRSARCPAHLTPEGLKCQNCGQCTIGQTHLLLERMGYQVFVVPGSSFIKRMVKKYRPGAIIGVGCLSEVKEGIEMADKMGLVGIGVVTAKEGCVETFVNWADVYDMATLGIDPSLIPEDFHVLAN